MVTAGGPFTARTGQSTGEQDPLGGAAEQQLPDRAAAAQADDQHLRPGLLDAVAEVGRPRVSSGTSTPAAAALLAASGPATPSIAPLPNSSGCLVSFRSVA